MYGNRRRNTFEQKKIENGYLKKERKNYNQIFDDTKRNESIWNLFNFLSCLLVGSARTFKRALFYFFSQKAVLALRGPFERYCTGLRRVPKWQLTKIFLKGASDPSFHSSSCRTIPTANNTYACFKPFSPRSFVSLFALTICAFHLRQMWPHRARFKT